MSQIQVDNIYNKEGDGSPGFPLGANVTGVITATTFKGGAEITSGTISATSVTATTGTFTSNVSIAGTLTYEDVTNIDSVGVITARQGINVSGGTGTFAGNINANGNIIGDSSTNISGISSVTATNFYGNGASLSGIEAAPTIQGVVNGSLSAEQSVIVESDGKVAPITFTAATAASAASVCCTDMQTTQSYPFYNMQGAYDSTTGRTVAIYRKSDGMLNFVVGTRSGTSITWGTAASLTGSHGVSQGCLDVCCIGTDKFFAIYGSNPGGNSANCFVAAITTNSSNEFTRGTEVQVSSSGIFCPRVVYDTKNSGVLMAYSNGNKQSRWATVSGTTVTLSAENQWHTGDFSQGNVNYDSTNGIMLIGWVGNATSYTGDPQVAYIYKDPNSAATLHGSMNSPYAAEGKEVSVVHNPITNRYYAFFTKNNGYSYYTIGTYNAAQHSVTWGTQAANQPMNPNNEPSQSFITSSIDIATGKIIISYLRGGKQRYSTYGWDSVYVLVNEVAETDWNSSTDDPVPLVPLENMAFAFGYNTSGSSGGWQIKQFDHTDLSGKNFIGFSKAAYTNGQTATIKVVGNVSTQSSLTPGEKYYVQNNGTLAITAGDPSVVGGRALTSTSLLIQPV